MRKIIIFLALNNFWQLQAQSSDSLTYVNDEKELNKLIFGNIIDNCSSSFLLNLGNAQSKIFDLTDSLTGLVTATDWMLAYNDLVVSNIDTSNHFVPIGEYYTKFALQRHSNVGDILQLPLACLFTDYNYVNVEEQLSLNSLIIDENGQTLIINTNSTVIKTETIFSCAILADTISIYETLRINFSSNQNISKELISSIDLFNDNTLIGTICDNSVLDIQVLEGDNNFYVKYYSNSGDTMTCGFSFYGKSLDISKANGVFSLQNIINTPSESFQTSNMDGISQSAEIKIFYGCGNDNNLILKPAIMVSGYNPVNLENYITLATKFNTNGYLQSLHERGYDVIIIRFNYGSDRIENQALLTKHILKVINQRKFNNNSFIENVMTGYSSGALVGRMALKMMEVEYRQNPGIDKLHHTKLLVSYDGEHQGANIPLAAQHGIRSIIDNPQWYLPGTNLINALEQYFLLSSPMAKDFLIYHYSQTGNENNPDQAPHPYFVQSRYKFVTDLYYQSDYDKPGDYPMLRNVGVADGAAGILRYPIGNLPQNSTLLKIEKHVGFLGWDRHNYMEWKAVDGQGHFIFKRLFEKKPFFSTNYTVLLDEKKFTNNNVLNLDGIQGSTVSLYNALRSAVKYTYLNSNPEIDVASKDCFLPTSSALDIGPMGTSSMEVDLRANNLLWYIPQSFPPNQEQNKQFGYPSIYHGNSQYNKTPFDAIYAAKINLKHGAGSENDPNAEGLTELLLDETHYEDIWLQFLRIGIWTGTTVQYNYYPVKYEALNSIQTGENVTYKTQHKPFEVNEKADVEMKAGNFISFKPGTHIKNGAILHAYIQYVETCEDAGKSAGANGYNDTDETNTILTKDERQESRILTVYPNPNSRSFSFDNPFEGASQVNLFNYTGDSIFSETITSGKKDINLSLKSGFYILKLTHDADYLTTKILIK